MPDVENEDEFFGPAKFKLLCGDSFEILKTIENKSIDLLVTDPPYEHVMGGMKSKFMLNGAWNHKSYMNQKMSQFGYEEIIKFLDLVRPKMKKVNMYIFCSRLQISHYLEWIKKEKLKYDLLIWNKGLKALKSTKFFAQDIEYVVRIYESGVHLRKITSDDGKVETEYYLKCKKIEQPHGKHETIKPVKLISHYIELSSDEGDTILDPFMGSGTTSIACKRLKRNFIGIEINEDYYKLAKNELENEIAQMTIFDYM